MLVSCICQVGFTSPKKLVTCGNIDYTSSVILGSDGIGWSLQLSELLEGVYDVEVSLTDASTNETNVDLTQDELVIDRTPPQ